ncbi:Anion exchange protein 2 [Cichlidogyrus casuarinus]|uniref:Anion exchange protein 2 n=1 Tax=Cichlidogyrus casuarinus TaxID=1844966 RepID=A0ABD2PJ00_9PLAT
MPMITKPYLVFIRLGRPLRSRDMTELGVASPIRFLVVCVGPKSFVHDYAAFGRLVSTLLIDPMFLEACYLAQNVQDLIHAVDKLELRSMVLPTPQRITPCTLMAMYRQLKNEAPRMQRRKTVLRLMPSQCQLINELPRSNSWYVVLEPEQESERDFDARNTTLEAHLNDLKGELSA